LELNVRAKDKVYSSGHHNSFTHVILFLLTAIAIKLESKGPIFFRQQRALARGSITFIFYKFRTMVEGADDQKNHLYDQNESNGALFKIRDDHA